MSVQIGRGRNSRPQFLDPDQMKHTGSVLSTENSQILQSLLLGKVAEMDPEDALITSSSMLQGSRPQGVETTIPAYECITKQKKTVTVTSVQAMEAIINNGGEFVGEVRQTVKL